MVASRISPDGENIHDKEFIACVSYFHRHLRAKEY